MAAKHSTSLRTAAWRYLRYWWAVRRWEAGFPTEGPTGSATADDYLDWCGAWHRHKRHHPKPVWANESTWTAAWDRFGDSACQCWGRCYARHARRTK
jgi:hypothetical protein